jgi:Cu+-exporting ATPase
MVDGRTDTMNMQPSAASGATPLQNLSFGIEGMTCASCVGRVEKALARVPGVERASVNLGIEKAEVVADLGRVSAKEIAGAVDEAGYTPRLASETLRSRA